MIEEVILDVKRAEDEAAQITEKSLLDAKEITVQAEIKAEGIRKKTAAECKEELKNAINKAETQAESERAAILEKGRADAAALVAEKKKEVDAVADFIVDAFVKKF
ncbi:MAG: hypothetical protein PUG65_00125 [Firmicutes bacterium]|nr:hypothetical protein [Bacillota bacterium]MDY4559921.1 hypothetical protein [Eubacteriales bacterium]